MAPGSDRACEKWMADYAIPDSEDLALHHFYRAMAWLGEELPEAEQAGATPFAPRCVKDLIEERMVAQRRDLFSELSVVFMDTTTLSFVGAGGAMLGRRGHSKDHRPELMQMVLGVVIDADGRPVCTEMWPGNTADVCALLPIVERLRTRFAIGRVCVVADRGMISQPTIAALEERGLEYVLGVRERTDSLVRRVVLEDRQPFTPLCVPRANGAETQLWVKEMVVEGRRYVVCRNEAEANKGAADRKAVLDGLERQLRKGDKALIGGTPPTAASSRARPRRRSRSIPARSPMRPGSMASSSCAPTPGSARCRRSCGIATCSRSRISSGRPKRSCASGRSTTPRMPPSAATCSARFWRWC
jgi:hypothetical protein